MDAKRKITITATLLIIITIIVASFAILVLKNPDMAAYEAQTRKIFEDAKTKFETIRNVTLPSDIELFVYTKQQAEDRWGRGYADSNLDAIHRQENIYRGLFMMSEDESLYEAAVEWVACWVAATLGNEIYVIYENFDPWDMPNAEATLIHELTHVWQPDLVSPTDFDVDKAHTALVEGDASYMGDYSKTQYEANACPQNLYGNPLVFLLDSTYLGDVHPSTPSTVSKLNWFPYEQGKIFVTSIIENNSWSGLNLCYDPAYTPSTTEQILHLDKYYANETAKIVTTPSMADENWTLIKTSRGYDSDTYGECFIQIMLSNWLNDENTQIAIEAAAGWGGDNFTYYEKGDEFLFIWNIVWDSTQDASEFYQAFI
ncbi:MAG: hypothetical protein GX638_02930, partial [Crenarchaeota archaeon]|nr:hypothetical protein [Thermoproteota archaeon]